MGGRISLGFFFIASVFTLIYLSIGTPKNSKFSICSKWKINYFQVFQNFGTLQPNYNMLKYWDT